MVSWGLTLEFMYSIVQYVGVDCAFLPRILPEESLLQQQHQQLAIAKFGSTLIALFKKN